jgi:hypothetical protein
LTPNARLERRTSILSDRERPSRGSDRARSPSRIAPPTPRPSNQNADEHGSKTDSTSVFEYRERLTPISAFSMPSARASKRSDGLVGFRWKPSWFLHHRLRGQRFENGVTGDVSRRTAGKSAQGAYESNKHEDFFHLDLAVSNSLSLSEAV